MFELKTVKIMMIIMMNTYYNVDYIDNLQYRRNIWQAEYWSCSHFVATM